MIENKIKNAIAILEAEKILKSNTEFTQCVNTVVEALEKQIPKKPIIKSEKEKPITHRLGRLLCFHCPTCGRFLLGLYETDVERGGGITQHLKGCSNCLQAIDFIGYYCQEKNRIENKNEEKIVHAYWKNVKPYTTNGKYLKAQVCSNCGSYFISNGNEPYSNHRYCCECGATMDGETKDF